MIEVAIKEKPWPALHIVTSLPYYYSRMVKSKFGCVFVKEVYHIVPPEEQGTCHKNSFPSSLQNTTDTVTFV